jgi:NAD-dependent deacetylase
MKAKKKLIVLTGAGISAESGLKTFRDSDGLWEGHSIEDVATPAGWHKDQALVLNFYNERRRDGLNAKPNAGHLALKDLEKYFDVQIITQNVDNLHEKAGSTKVMHLHGEIFKSQSTRNPDLVYDMDGWELNIGDKCELGSQLRPFIVWFGEAVPMIEPAVALSQEADIFVVVGTSLAVYPAASLVYYAPPQTPIFVVDPKVPDMENTKNVTFIEEPASTGVETLKKILIEKYL